MYIHTPTFFYGYVKKSIHFRPISIIYVNNASFNIYPSYSPLEIFDESTLYSAELSKIYLEYLTEKLPKEKFIIYQDIKKFFKKLFYEK